MADIPQGQNQNPIGASKPSLTWQTPAASSKPQMPNTPQTSAPKPPVSTPPSKVNGANTGNSNMSTYIVIFVAGLVVGALLGWGIGGRGNSSTTATSTSTGTDTTMTGDNTPISDTSTMGTAPATGSVVVDSPQSAGSSVAVSKVDVSKPTWVVVYDDNNGAAGKALGATLFFPASANGDTSGSVDLLRPTVSGTTYLVGELLDDGDPNLSFSTDKPIVDSNGKPILMTLTAN